MARFYTAVGIVIIVLTITSSLLLRYEKISTRAYIGVIITIVIVLTVMLAFVLHFRKQIDSTTEQNAQFISKNPQYEKDPDLMGAQLWNDVEAVFPDMSLTTKHIDVYRKYQGIENEKYGIRFQVPEKCYVQFVRSYDLETITIEMAILNPNLLKSYFTKKVIADRLTVRNAIQHMYETAFEPSNKITWNA